MPEHCSRPVKLTLKEQHALLYFPELHVLWCWPKRKWKRKREIKLFRQDRLNLIPWHDANGDALSTRSLRNSMARLQPHRTDCTYGGLKLSFQTFAKIQAPIMSLLRQRDQSHFEDWALREEVDWGSLRVGDLWVLTSILYQRWPPYLMPDCEPTATWACFLKAGLEARAKALEIINEGPWKIAVNLVKGERYIDDNQPDCQQQAHGGT